MESDQKTDVNSKNRRGRYNRIVLGKSQLLTLAIEFENLPREGRKVDQKSVNRLLRKYGYKNYNSLYNVYWNAKKKYGTELDEIRKRNAQLDFSDSPQKVKVKKHSPENQIAKITMNDDSIIKTIVDVIVKEKTDVNISQENGEIKLRF